MHHPVIYRHRTAIQGICSILFHFSFYPLIWFSAHNFNVRCWVLCLDKWCLSLDGHVLVNYLFLFFFKKFEYAWRTCWNLNHLRWIICSPEKVHPSWVIPVHHLFLLEFQHLHTYCILSPFFHGVYNVVSPESLQPSPNNMSTSNDISACH